MDRQTGAKYVPAGVTHMQFNLDDVYSEMPKSKRMWDSLRDENHPQSIRDESHTTPQKPSSPQTRSPMRFTNLVAHDPHLFDLGESFITPTPNVSRRSSVISPSFPLRMDFQRRLSVPAISETDVNAIRSISQMNVNYGGFRWDIQSPLSVGSPSVEEVLTDQRRMSTTLEEVTDEDTSAFMDVEQFRRSSVVEDMDNAPKGSQGQPTDLKFIMEDPTQEEKKKESKYSMTIFKCPEKDCDKTFSRYYNLRSHYKIHTGNKPFKCKNCSKSFARNHDLKRHEKIHTGERPHKCPTCQKQFSRNDALQRHLKFKSCSKSKSNMKNISENENF